MDQILDEFASAWNEFNIFVALAIFLAYIIVDALYAFYTLEVTKKNAVSAATTGAIMHFLLAFGVLNYVNNFLYLLPLAIGSWLGTYLVVKKLT